MIYYYLFVNIALFYMFYTDKQRAKQGKWRMKEFDLLLYGALGGCVGGLLGMLVFKHKTKKIKFYMYYTIFVFLHVFIWQLF